MSRRRDPLFGYISQVQNILHAECRYGDRRSREPVRIKIIADVSGNGIFTRDGNFDPDEPGLSSTNLKSPTQKSLGVSNILDAVCWEYYFGLTYSFSSCLDAVFWVLHTTYSLYFGATFGCNCQYLLGAGVSCFTRCFPFYF